MAGVEMTARLCVICGHNLDGEPQTCITCLARTRSALLEIAELYALLPAELEDHAGAASPPGSVIAADSDSLPDALVLLAGGTNGNVNGGRPTRDEPDGNRAHSADQWDTDTPSVLGVLATWEDDWRGPNVAQHAATVAGSVDYLTAHLARQAQQHPAFDEFATDIRHLLGSMHYATRTGEHIEHGVPCLDCGTRLRRQARKPSPCSHTPDRHAADCDQGGLGDWRCPNPDCPRTRYSEADYLLACAEHWRRHDLDSEAC
jgi:hypothetical protein